MKGEILMHAVDVTVGRWRKSSYSTGDGHNGDCVEVAFAGEAVAVRDSKHPGPRALIVPAVSWRGFVSGLPR